MSNKEPGYVYILTNPSFREDWVKIGKSSRPVDVRSKELDNTAVPLPFEIFATMKTVKYNEVEALVHKTIDGLTNLRIRPNREFFNVPPQKALDIFNNTLKSTKGIFIIVLPIFFSFAFIITRSSQKSKENGYAFPAFLIILSFLLLTRWLPPKA